MRDHTPSQVLSEHHNLDNDLIDFSLPAAEAGRV